MMSSPKLHGFTLLELLVVLFLLSLIAAVAIPRLTQVYNSVQIAYEREEALAQIGSLSFLAYQRSLEFNLISYPLPETVSALRVDNFQKVVNSGVLDEGTKEDKGTVKQTVSNHSPPQSSPSTHSTNLTSTTDEETWGKVDLVPSPLELPAGWELRTEKPIHFFSNGVCTGGVAYLIHQTQQFRLQLVAPFCWPQLIKESTTA